MKLTGAQAVAVADFADGDDVFVNDNSTPPHSIIVSKVGKEHVSAVVDTDGTIFPSKGFNWKKTFGKNLTLTT